MCSPLSTKREMAQQATDLWSLDAVCWGFEVLDDDRVAQQWPKLEVTKVADL